jgi:hypothetical protein
MSHPKTRENTPKNFAFEKNKCLISIFHGVTPSSRKIKYKISKHRHPDHHVYPRQ